MISFVTNDQVVDIAPVFRQLSLTDGHVFARSWKVAAKWKGAVDAAASFTSVSHNSIVTVAIAGAKGEERQECFVDSSASVSPVPITSDRILDQIATAFRIDPDAASCSHRKKFEKSS